MATTSSVEAPVKRALMSLLKRGAISTRQAAAIGCVSRQAVEKWVAKEGWDIDARRKAFALREFTKLMDGRRMPSKRELRREADEASKTWEWRRDPDRSVDLAEMGPRKSRAPAREL